MLVLSRQRDETIMIGDDIEITIVDIRGDKVRLGITAPATIPVHRKEVYEAIQRENRDAAKVKMEDLSNLPTPPNLPKVGPGGHKGHGGPGTHPRPPVPFSRPPGNGTNPQPGRPAAPHTPPQPPAQPSAQPPPASPPASDAEKKAPPGAP